MSMLAKLFAKEIAADSKTIKDVPKGLRAAVEELLQQTQRPVDTKNDGEV